MPDTPQFDYPFRRNRGEPVTVEQDSSDEILAAALSVVKTPPGSRIELPDFGCEDQTLKENGPDLDQVQAALDRWEPRARYALDAIAPDALSSFVNVALEGGADA